MRQIFIPILMAFIAKRMPSIWNANIAVRINLSSRTLPSVVYISARDTRRTRGDRDKNVFVGASARILRRPNNYIPRVVPRRPSPRARLAFDPGASPRPVLYSICAILRTVPAWKISIHETPYGHSRDQSCTLYVPGISIRLHPVFDGLAPGFRFDFARERRVVATSRVVTFQFVPSGQIYGRLWRFTLYWLARRLKNKKKSQSAISHITTLLN